MMSAQIIAGCTVLYFAVLILVSYITTRKINEKSYYDGNKASPWYAVAFGMLGDSLSGVTFISVPGAVLLAHFGYFQVVLGYFVGYLIIMQVLLPLYYRLELVSIYTYLNHRFGIHTEYTGAFFFMLSRVLGSAARLYLAASVFQFFLFDSLGIPFGVTVGIIIFLIWLYTVKGGIKTLVWTDTFQSLMLILGVVFTIIAMQQKLDWGFVKTAERIYHSPYSQIFNWDWASKNNFWKQFVGGAFISVCMTGLDQNMMQKNLTIKTLGEAQKNIFWFSIILLLTNICFLSLGALLYIYAEHFQIALPLAADGKVITDKVFPYLAMNYLGLFAGISFVVGLAAATFSSADSVLTTLTTSYFYDFLHIMPSKESHRLRNVVHLLFALILLFCILIIQQINTSAIIDVLLVFAQYTYGPLLGLFFFGLYTKYQIKDRLVPMVCIFAPIFSYLIDNYAVRGFYFLGGHSWEATKILATFQFGNLMLLINGVLTVVGLWAIRRKLKMEN